MAVERCGSVATYDNARNLQLVVKQSSNTILCRSIMNHENSAIPVEKMLRGVLQRLKLCFCAKVKYDTGEAAHVLE